MKKHIAIVFFALISFRECSEPGTLIRKSRNARMKDVTIAMVSDSSALKTKLARPDIW
jgi:hypothetical protein